MIPKRVELENFLSFESAAIEFADGEPLWVLSGPNGVGKSAVFDAITFALFGCHRGGKTGADNLVRHGSNGLRVAFTFAFNDIDYRITRAQPLKGRIVRKVERLVDGNWSPIELPPKGRTDVIADWAEELLGLGHDAFCASVLLRQGEADLVIRGTGAERLNTLKKIIGAEKFEALSKEVHDVTKRYSGRYEDAKRARDQLTAVTEEELKDAHDRSMAAEGDRVAAQNARTAAEGLVAIAGRWAEVEPKRAELTKKIAAADERAKGAAVVRMRKNRFDALETVVPVYREATLCRRRIEAVSPQLELDRTEHAKLTEERDVALAATTAARTASSSARAEAEAAERDVAQGKKDLTTATGHFALAEEAERLVGELVDFPADLDDRALHAKSNWESAMAAVDFASDAKASATARATDAKKLVDSFAEVDVGVACSRCGQPVTTEHVTTEKARLRDGAERLATETAKATAVWKTAVEARKAADAEWKRIDAESQKRDALKRDMSGKRGTLQNLGIYSTTAEIRAGIERTTTHVVARDAVRATQVVIQTEQDRLAKEADTRRIALDANLTTVTERVRRTESQLDNDRTLLESYVTRLPAGWSADASEAEVDTLVAERATLAKENLPEAVRQLNSDQDRREEWQNQLADWTRELDAIPPPARVPVDTAKASAAAAKAAADSSEVDAIAARDAWLSLLRAHEAFVAAVLAVDNAEKLFTLHSKLDEHLGRTGLQRALVRDSEADIVRFAAETVRNLSHGDLEVELAEAEGNDDEAFDLRVRRAGDSVPIPVDYLSGSQKFRVAVAVALAIGRYAAGRARPLESVIIDEGFGSLDKDGLRAMADELKALQSTQALARIVLVSHQDEFIEHFPVGYRLVRGENGTTTATAFRK